MENRITRPISVWIAQIVMIGGAVLFFVAFLLVMFMLTSLDETYVAIILIASAMYLGLMGLFIAAFVGMARRKQWGRWLAVGLLSLMVIFGVVGQFARPSGPFEYAEYENVTQAAAGFMTGIIILGLMLWLTLSLAFGKRARSFFSGTDLEAPPQIVP